MGLFRDRVLPFDIDAARHYAELAVSAKDGGRGFPTPDGYIAAIAASRKLPWRHAIPLPTKRQAFQSSIRGKNEKICDRDLLTLDYLDSFKPFLLQKGMGVM